MSDEGYSRADVAKSRNGLMTAALVMVLVVAAIVAAMGVMELGPFAKQAANPPAVAKPDPEPEKEPVEPEKPADPLPVSYALPPADAMEVMYWEQVASRELITALVEDQFESFDLSQRATNSHTSDIRVTGTYREGGQVSGWLLMRKYGDAWFFSMITRDGHPTSTPVGGTADESVAKAIAEQQTENQDIPQALADGTYTGMKVDRVTAGSGTAMIDVTLTGSTVPMKGQITCISKDINGQKHWFITAFSRR